MNTFDHFRVPGAPPTSPYAFSFISNYSTRMCPTCDQDPNPRSYCIICSLIKVSIPVRSGGATTDASPLLNSSYSGPLSLRYQINSSIHQARILSCPRTWHLRWPLRACQGDPACTGALGNSDRYSARSRGREVCNSPSSIFLISKGSQLDYFEV